MEQKNFLIIDKSLEKDLIDYCKLNNIEDIEKFKIICFTMGFNIKKYGLLNHVDGDQIVQTPKEIEVIKYVDREIIKEIPVEKIVEVIKEIKVPVEKIVEVTKEIPVEKIVEVVKEIPIKTETEKIIISDEDKNKELIIKILDLEKKHQDCENKNTMISQTLQDLRSQIRNREIKIGELENKIRDLSVIIEKRLATFHTSSNLKDKL